MKTSIQIIVAALLLCAVPLKSNAQKAGIKGGVNFSNLFNDEVDDENMRIGFHAGVYGQFMFASGTIGLQPELLYSTKGAQGNYNVVGLNGEYKFNLDYIDLPVLLVFKLGEDVDLNVGPYFSYLVRTSVSSEGDLGSSSDEIDRDHLKSFDYGLIGGITFNFGPLGIGARYNYGLQKIADSDVAETLLGNSKNGVGQIYATFNFSK